MQRILIFGNSGSGKSTLAARLRDAQGLAHLDLDVLAWLPSTPPERRPLAESGRAISEFVAAHENWVIEGCYTDLLQLAAPLATEAIFLNLSVAQCQANARKRPWEPHKYSSPAAQDANLAMLLDWIAQYPERDDTLSLRAHRQFFEAFPGYKLELTENTGQLARGGRPR